MVIKMTPPLPPRQRLTTTTNTAAETDPESIYEFYKEHIFPAIMSSFPILLKRVWNDIITYVALAAHKLYLFILPTWWKQQQQQIDDNDNNNNDSNGRLLDGVGNNFTSTLETWLVSTQQQLWEQAVESSKTVNATIAEFMLHHFDTNNDGHISAKELLNMTELLSKLPILPTNQHNDNNNNNLNVESFWMWFSREWPLMDWKIGMFLWSTFGGLLIVIAVLSIMPGRLHSWSGKILRWPILGLTYLLISVELIVYIVIRLVIRVAETIFATPKHRTLRRQMAEAKSFEEWYEFAAALDLSQKRDKWQRTTSDATSYQYNWPLIQQLITDMREARQKQDVLLALAVLQQCTRKNVGGIMSEDLFTKTYTGEPKFIVIEFITEVTKTLHWATEMVMSFDADDDDDDVDDDNGIDTDFKDIPITTTTTTTKVVGKKGHHDSNQLYKKSMERKMRDEKQHLWQSLVGLAMNVATLNFNNNDDDKLQQQNHNNAKKKDNISKPNNNNIKSATPVGSPARKVPTGGAAASDGLDVLDISYASSGDLLSDVGSEGVRSTKSSVSAQQIMAHREQLLTFLKRARAAYGRTALCLSGGAMMGLYHFGHLKGLMETDCLPNIVSGCSAGSVIGAILCTRTNDELSRDLDPEVIGPHMKCFDRSWPDCLVSFWRTGNLFSADDWHRMIKWYVYFT